MKLLETPKVYCHDIITVSPFCALEKKKNQNSLLGYPKFPMQWTNGELSNLGGAHVDEENLRPAHTYCRREQWKLLGSGKASLLIGKELFFPIFSATIKDFLSYYHWPHCLQRRMISGVH